MLWLVNDNQTFGERVGKALLDFGNLVVAGGEIIAGQLGTDGLDPISTDAGRLLFEAGVVASVDDGIVLFHERITRNKPSLRRVLRAVDRKAGRLKKVKRSPAQRAMDQALRAGEVTRNELGRITGLTTRGRAAVKRAKRLATVKSDAKKRARQKTALSKLKGIGG